MLKKIFVIGSMSSLLMFFFCFNSSGETNDETMIIRKVKNTLEQMHYSARKIDDSFSKEVFKRYLDYLDPYKRYFKESDYNEFKKYELQLDDDFNNENLDFYHLSIERYYQRIDEAEKIVNEILENNIDFNQDDFLITDEKKRTYSKTEQEYKNEWSRFLKYQILRETETMQTEDKEDQDNKSDKKKERKNIEIDKFASLKDSATIEVKDNMKDFFRRVKARKKKDYLSLYINSLTEAYDPHTSYLSPKDKESFNSSISGKIIGVGAKLQDKKGYPTFSELIVGGPAWKSKQIEAGDKIIKVGQGSKEPVNVVGMLLEDAIQLIRGKENTEVVLVIQKKDGTIKNVKLTREEIEMEESFAKSVIIEDENKQKFGYIYLPEFYIDLENPSQGRSCADDMKKEIIELQKENIKGLIVDLRNNGGGSLSEVVKMVGEFIPEGPVVQVRRSDGYEEVHKDTDKSIDYKGNLVVLVNEMSASASEIFAAAIQDYKRGIIIGSSKTYGKGTVQTVVPLERFNFSNDKYGAVKLTIQKFYRINGSSTQQKGVIPDIILKSPYEYSDISEASEENSLPWDQVKPISFGYWQNNIDYNFVKNNSEKRIKNEIFLTKVEEKAKWIKDITKEEKVPLNYRAYLEDTKNKNEVSEKYDKDLEYDTKLNVSYPKYELAIIKKDTVLKNKRQKWHKNITKDFYIKEAINVLNDMK